MRSAGCGAAMRVSCIGLFFRRPDDLDNLIALTVEACRLTKSHPTGYLGGVCASVFTAFAFQGIPVIDWGSKLVNEIIPLTQDYVVKEG
jgi:ADP-ribosylarginine hydrolase